MEDDDFLDGCEEDFAADPIADEDTPFVALFAGIPPEDVEAVAAEYRKVFGAEEN